MLLYSVGVAAHRETLRAERRTQRNDGIIVDSRQAPPEITSPPHRQNAALLRASSSAPVLPPLTHKRAPRSSLAVTLRACTAVPHRRNADFTNELCCLQRPGLLPSVRVPDYVPLEAPLAPLAPPTPLAPPAPFQERPVEGAALHGSIRPPHEAKHASKKGKRRDNARSPQSPLAQRHDFATATTRRLLAPLVDCPPPAATLPPLWAAESYRGVSTANHVEPPLGGKGGGVPATSNSRGELWADSQPLDLLHSTRRVVPCGRWRDSGPLTRMHVRPIA